MRPVDSLDSREVRQYLDDLIRSGVSELPKSSWQPELGGGESASGEAGRVERVPDSGKQAGLARERESVRAGGPAELSTGSPSSGSPDVAGHQSAVPRPVSSHPVAPERRAHALEILAEEVAGCRRCQELAGRRTQTVFGVGNPSARVCFFGEAPGADEDRVGEPFVGKAGQLLTRIIEASTFKREDVYILNAVKCRPPGNRNPEEGELASCREYWERQLEIIQPEYIIGLGVFAVRSLLEVDAPLSRLRGRLHQYKGSKVIVTYHPAYLLRNESAKRLVWDDMKLLLRSMGRPIPGAG